MMNQCIVPNWDMRSQRQVEEIVEGEEGNRSSHVHTNLQNQSHLVPMSSYEIAELTWENGQPAMHGLGGLIPAPASPTKPTWVRACDTLESMVHQATMPQHGHNPANVSSTAASSAGKWADTSGCELVNQLGLVKKRMRPESDQCGRNLSRSVQEEYQRPEGSACASASATFCKDNDTNMMTWASCESTRSLKTKTTDDEEDSFHDGSENQDETKGETGRSHSTRRSRVAAIHNQSERRRRDRINQKMKALQKLVPNASKTDKASMLDEIIEYLKQLQAQVQFMMARSMPQMVMPPLGMQQQQQIQMSLLARMGMGVGLGMGMGVRDFTALARAAAATAAASSAASQSHLPQLLHSSQPVAAAAAATIFVPPPFVVPPTPDAALPNVSIPFNFNPYCTFPGQPMNMDLYNKMAVMYQQQVMNQTTQPTSNPLLSSQAKFKADDQTLHY